MTTPTVKELQAQIASLQAQVAQVRQVEVVAAVAKIHAILDEYSLTASDVFPSGKSAKTGEKQKGKATPKYRDPATGTTWSGRGLTPNWIRGKEFSEFLIK